MVQILCFRTLPLRRTNKNNKWLNLLQYELDDSNETPWQAGLGPTMTLAWSQHSNTLSLELPQERVLFINTLLSPYWKRSQILKSMHLVIVKLKATSNVIKISSFDLRMISWCLFFVFPMCSLSSIKSYPYMNIN